MNNKKSVNQNIKFEISILAFLIILINFFGIKYDLLEKLFLLTRNYENYELDEILTILIFTSFVFLLYYIKKVKDLYTANKVISDKIKALESADSEINQLKGMLTICSSCKNIKLKDGYWQNIDQYISDHSDIKFSHGICLDCAKKLYPDVLNRKKIQQ